MDSRDIQAQYGNWYDRFDEERMAIVMVVHDDDGGEKEVNVSARYEVCSLCEGQGSHVNPSIDHNGLSAEDMYDLGDDFEEDYFGGVYDVSCYRCKGKRVEPVVNWDALTPELRKKAEDRIEDHNDHVRECVSEARYLGEW